MASPYPTLPQPSESRRIRPGAELRDFRVDRDDGKILPLQGERNVLITSALPYVNNQPHLGNIIGSTLSADVFARYSRGRNVRTLYVCGTDEYGTTTEVMAAKEGLSPQALCDKYHKLHRDAYEWFEIGFDYFGRTTTPQQTEICQGIFLDLHKNGFLEEKEMTQLYCENDKRYLADRYVEGKCPNPECNYPDARGDQCESCSRTHDPLDLIDPRCSACGAPPTTRTTSHFFLRLPALQPEIEAWVRETSAKGHWSSNGRAFTNSWLAGGLKERCMTRDLEWGVKLPKELGDKWQDKVMYVWFDAPIGYPSITANYSPDWREWWTDPANVSLYQFMGKDNVPFHTVLFPSYLMGTRKPWTLLDSISTTDYLQYEGTKFSKSKNVGVFGSNARDTGIPPSVWRYYLLSIRPEDGDSEFTWNNFVQSNNSELLNKLGNFVNRVIKFTAAKYDSKVPGEAPQFAEDDASFVADLDGFLETYVASMEQQRFRQALAATMSLAARGNQYLQENRLDNTLFAQQPERCAQVVLVALNAIYVLSALITPFMPSTGASIARQLDAPPRTIPDTFTVDVLPGHQIGTPEYLFRRIDDKMVEVWRAQFGGAEVQRAREQQAAERAAKQAQAGDKAAKKKAAKSAKGGRLQSDAPTAAKTPEQVELEKRIADQGQQVRRLKAGEQEGDVKAEVEQLLSLKRELADLTESLSKM